MCIRTRLRQILPLLTIVALGVVLLPPAGAAGASTAPGAASTPRPTPVAAMNVPYGSGPDRRLDVVALPDAADAPIAMIIHGGGFVRGDKEANAVEARQLANAGFVVFLPNYSLDPSQPAYPRQVDDVHSALDWIEEHAAEYGGDPARVTVIGGSAGAYLAAMLGNQANSAESAPVRVMASLSTAMDFTTIAEELRANVVNADGTCSPIDCESARTGSENIKSLLGCDPVECPDDLLREASPISYVTEYSPASFLASGSEENIPPDQATEMAEVLRDNGVETHVELVPGNVHGSAYLPQISEKLLTFVEANNSAAPVVTTPPPTTTAPVVADEEPSRGRRLPLRWIAVGLVVVLLGAAAAIRLSRGRTSAP